MPFKSILLKTTAALLILPIASNAQDYNKGWAAYETGDFETAFKQWIVLAEEGNAQVKLDKKKRKPRRFMEGILSLFLERDP